MDCFGVPPRNDRGVGMRNDEGLAFSLSLRGSVRNRGNPVFDNEPHWIASACRLAMTEGLACARTEGLAVSLSLRGFARNRGNPVFDNEPHWIASACRLAMTADLSLGTDSNDEERHTQ